MKTHKIEELINEYKENVFICSQINYNDKKSIKLNNRAVGRMYQIVNIINADLGEKEINEFSKLLDIEDYRTNVWVAVQMLEKIKVNNEIEKRALTILKKDAETSIGMDYWLKNYMKQKESIK